MQKQLTSKGFGVEVRRDLDSKGIGQTFTGFLRRAPTNGTVVLAFTGHGVSQAIGQQRRRWIGWQGVGAAKDELSAERVCYKCDRLESLITKESGGPRHLLIMDFVEENPMLKEAVEDALGNGELQVYRKWRGALSALPAQKKSWEWAENLEAKAGNVPGEPGAMEWGRSFAGPAGKVHDGQSGLRGRSTGAGGAEPRILDSEV